MKITIIAESENEDDGFTGSVTVVRENVEFAWDLSKAFTDAAIAIGFTYVEDVGLKCKGSEVKWGEGNWFE